MINPHKIKVTQVATNEGMTFDELLEAYGGDSVVPACCDESCQVEPDGRCEHNCPSILLALGVI